MAREEPAVQAQLHLPIAPLVSNIVLFVLVGLAFQAIGAGRAPVARAVLRLGLASIAYLVAGWNLLTLVRGRLARGNRLVVGVDRVVLHRLPVGGQPIERPVSALRHAYFLRRAGRSGGGPLLVVETDAESIDLPGDWFAGDDDQRRIAEALQARIASEPA